MTAGKVTADITISLDGYVAGPNQSLENPLGERGNLLHRWMFEQAETNSVAIAAITEPAAFIMGRNMFGPGRGAWDSTWQGWWGAEPPYNAPVFVLTNFAREPMAMNGDTTFTFVTEGIEAALSQAHQAARGGNVGIAGGARVVRQYLSAGLIDELRLHISPVLLGAGERLFDGVADISLEPTEVSGTSLVTHLYYRVCH